VRYDGGMSMGTPEQPKLEEQKENNEEIEYQRFEELFRALDRPNPKRFESLSLDDMAKWREEMTIAGVSPTEMSPHEKKQQDALRKEYIKELNELGDKLDYTEIGRIKLRVWNEGRRELSEDEKNKMSPEERISYARSQNKFREIKEGFEKEYGSIDKKRV